MTDLVERLRERAEYDDLAVLIEAADEIERLRAVLVEWTVATGAATPDDYVQQMKADKARNG